MGLAYGLLVGAWAAGAMRLRIRSVRRLPSLEANAFGRAACSGVVSGSGGAAPVLLLETPPIDGASTRVSVSPLSS